MSEWHKQADDQEEKYANYGKWALAFRDSSLPAQAVQPNQQSASIAQIDIDILITSLSNRAYCLRGHKGPRDEKCGDTYCSQMNKDHGKEPDWTTIRYDSKRG